jgi:hypothetical protein
MQFEMEELLEQANEVQETLSRSYAVPDEIDETELEAGARPLSPSLSLYHVSYGFRLTIEQFKKSQSWTRLHWREKKKGVHTSRISTRRQISSMNLPSK